MSDVVIRDLKKQFDAKTVLNSINLEVQEGELVVLLGPSGCGKTTLLRCLAGLEEISHGEISIGGQTVDKPSTGRFVPSNKRGIGVVFQSYALWPHMTVRNNVAYALKIAKESPAVIRDRVDSALKNLSIYDRAEEYAGQLSGGQQQRVALARAMASQPKLMLFDEPLSNLDAKLRLKVRLDIRKLHRRSGITAVYVTHDQEEAMALADRIVVMNHGEIQQLATPEEVYNQPANVFVADFMGFENILPGATTLSDDGRPMFEVEGGAFQIPLKAGSSPVNSVAFRGAHLSVVENAALEADDATFIRGKVLTHTYLGGHTQVLVEVGENRLFANLSEGSRMRFGTPDRGSMITMKLNTARVVPLEDTPSHLSEETTEHIPISV